MTAVGAAQTTSKESQIMGGIRSDALCVLAVLVEHRVLRGQVTAGWLKEQTGLADDAFDFADTYLLQSGYVKGTLGGLAGRRWLTPSGVDFYASHRHEVAPTTEDRPPGSQPESREPEMPEARKVLVVHGRDLEARDFLFTFLRSIGLQPLEWSELVGATGKGSPYVGEVLDSAFSIAKAIVVLMTPDDEARLRKPLRKPGDPTYETRLTPQPRPNVLFEAGMALARFPDRTVLVELGVLRPFSDVRGRHVIRLEDTSEKRQDLAQRLKAAGCAVNLSGTDWHRAGDFPPVFVNDDGSRILTDEDIIGLLTRLPDFQDQDVREIVRECRRQLVHHGITKRSELEEVVESDRVITELRRIYKREFGRDIDPVAVCSWGVALHRRGLTPESIGQAVAELRRSPEWTIKHRG